ncbi:MAG: TetR/AcrR family transcriptional regulator [Lachnospiraceae bacterium]|nr:TetR/AcrR family transcriptional regulator [Lachnospiraceae bacterium]MBP3506033.1 TetR/AcrR family transcriptional regulator [Lachnospiraceae bacterium]
MEKKTDLRIIKTYASLTQAFYELLSQKKFEDITVNELCSHALIRRATFYKHFTDKNDFFTFIVRSSFQQYTPTYDYNSEQAQPITFYIQITKNILQFLSEREEMVHSFSTSSMHATLINILNEEISKEICLYLKEDQKKGAVFSASAEITAQFFTGAIINCIKYWFFGEHQLTEEELLEQLSALLRSFQSLV